MGLSDEKVNLTAETKTNSEQKKSRINPSKYQEIAYDIAVKIALGQYKEGERIYAKSAMSVQYGVSVETVRRAMNVLSDLGIVKIVKGSGVTVISKEKADVYVRQFTQVTSLVDLRSELIKEIEIQNESRERMDALIREFKERLSQFNQASPIIPYWIKLESDCPVLGKTLSELNFWHNTLATIMAILRNGELILSPGPYAELMDGDVLYYIGDEDCVQRVKALLSPSRADE